MSGENLILAMNAGSSSIKFAVYRSAHMLAYAFGGAIETAGGQAARLRLDGGDPAWQDACLDADGSGAASELLPRWLSQHVPAADLRAVAHRLVYGHADCAAPAVLDANLLGRLRGACSGSTEHLPAQLALIDALRRYFPAARHLACFDSSFHAAMPRVARTLPIPRRYHALGVRRYGFHGISCDYIVQALAGLAGPPTPLAPR